MVKSQNWKVAFGLIIDLISALYSFLFLLIASIPLLEYSIKQGDNLTQIR